MGGGSAGETCAVGTARHQGLRALPIPEIDQRGLAFGQLIPIRCRFPLLLRVGLVGGVIAKLVSAVGGRGGVSEALDHLARFLRQDLG